MSKIRILGAKNVQAAWNSIPHVTHFDEINMSKINRAKEKNNANPLAFMIRALSETLKEFPIFNSSLIENDQIVLKEYINIGIAVDTEEGLVVPVIQDADKLSLEEISAKVKELAEKARNKKLLNTNLKNRTITISSLGKSVNKDNSIKNNNFINQLKQLNDLYKSGVLTKEEFEKAKKRILN